jgi:hypothetical protein
MILSPCCNELSSWNSHFHKYVCSKCGKKFNKVVKKTEIIDLLKGRSFTIRNFDK